MEGLLLSVLKDMGVILLAPFQELSLIWQIAPIILIWAVMVFYFGTHKHEKLGWNTALGNGISLFWIIISAMQHIFSDSSSQFTYTKFFLIMVIAIYAIFIIFVSFKHTFSQKITYAFASPTPVYYFSAIVLLYAYGLIYLSISMLIAIVVLFIVLLIFIWLIELILPEMKEDDSDSDADFASKDSFGDIGKDSPPSTSMDDFKFDESTTDSTPGQETPSNTPDTNFDDFKF